ncbi:MAG: hypothetical protein SAJ12_11855 [Jaaginema sp. PMC 1079.18]|nr:hypothetical protein [Jaaginema sp. PMC 1080.18]MEC4851700.1 hypothetical protein [Jaaginema sp. PMC 1079.18]MEC4867230.1 hypothetical protein [Jaaginema sp. PMC 1078.18]
MTNFFDEQIDKQLRQLALAAQQSPPRSLKRQKALSQLMIMLQQSGGLCSPNRTYGAQYQEVRNEGLARLYIWICQNIHKYDPKKGEVLQWSNGRLKYLYIDAYRELNTEGQAIPLMLSLDDLNNPDFVVNQSLHTPSMSEEVRSLLEEDPTGEFQTTHIEGYPNANFRFIALQRLDGYSWKEISQQLHNISISTLSSFYNRTIEKLIPLFQDYLDN